MSLRVCHKNFRIVPNGHTPFQKQTVLGVVGLVELSEFCGSAPYFGMGSAHPDPPPAKAPCN